MKNTIGIGLGSLLAVGGIGQDEIILPPVISSHMVLQCEMAVPVWGQAKPGAKITVRFRDQEKTTSADTRGQWRIMLDPLEPGGPDDMFIIGKSELKIEYVLVGEVWLGSGQSNMAGSPRFYTPQYQFPINADTNNQPANHDVGLARLLDAAPYPHVRLIKSGWPGWQPATRDQIEKFSALMISFGIPLQKALNRPVGLIVGAVGGTPSGHWIPEEAYRADPDCKAVVATFAKTYDLKAALKKYDEKLAKWEQAAGEAKAAGKTHRAKPLIPQPAGECIGGQIGHLFEAHIRQFVPFGIRGVLWDQGEAGTAITGLDQCTLMGALIRGWRRTWGQGDFPFLYVQKPSGGGCAWDENDPVTTCWADHFASLPATTASADGRNREMYIRIMRYPNTVMVISSDLGGWTHPINKSGYGARAARTALGAVYGHSVEYSGPIYAAHAIEGAEVHVKFTHVGRGLAWRHGERLQGFALSGLDRVFHWANAVITNDTVIVSSPQVSAPVAVRYAWDKQHPWANLFNKDGLPALAFRTDEW